MCPNMALAADAKDRAAEARRYVFIGNGDL